MATNRPKRAWPRSLSLRSLSGRLLLATILFVMMAQIAVYAPFVARFHQELLLARIAAGQTAVLALEETANNDVSPRLKRELLANAGVIAVSLKRDDARRLILMEEAPPAAAQVYDLRTMTLFDTIAAAMECALFGGARVVRVIDTPRLGGGQLIDVAADERPIRAALMDYAQRNALIGLGIAAATGALIFLALNVFLVRPMQRLMRAMIRFGENPDDAAGILTPSGRTDEIGSAEQTLSQMQGELVAALASRKRLALLGEAVAKINHDLRNMLAGAQLVTERLETSSDPNVKKMAPRLMRALGRAARLTNDTLEFSKAGDRATKRAAVKLAPLVREAATAAGARTSARVSFAFSGGEALSAFADSDQLFRIFLNLIRNAVQAIEAGSGNGTVTASVTVQDGVIVADIGDTGPGIPDTVLARLFRPFGGGGTQGGTGLGLAIARELARAQGGDLRLVRTGPLGTLFRLTLEAAGAST